MNAERPGNVDRAQGLVNWLARGDGEQQLAGYLEREVPRLVRAAIVTEFAAAVREGAARAARECTDELLGELVALSDALNGGEGESGPAPDFHGEADGNTDTLARLRSMVDEFGEGNNETTSTPQPAGATSQANGRTRPGESLPEPGQALAMRVRRRILD